MDSKIKVAVELAKKSIAHGTDEDTVGSRLAWAAEQAYQALTDREQREYQAALAGVRS